MILAVMQSNYEKRIDAINKKYGLFNDTNYNPIMPLIEIIKGWGFVKGTKGLKCWEESFKDYVCPFRRSKRNVGFIDNIRQKLNCGPQLLSYPCKPNAEDHASYADPNNLMPIPPAVSNYSKVENELNATISGGEKYALDAHRFPLTENIHPLLLSHATLLDFIFANADVISEEGQKDSVTACLNAFLELYNEEPKFREKLDDGLLLQAMHNAPDETQIYIADRCPALAEYSPITNEDFSK